MKVLLEKMLIPEWPPLLQSAQIIQALQLSDALTNNFVCLIFETLSLGLVRYPAPHQLKPVIGLLVSVDTCVRSYPIYARVGPVAIAFDFQSRKADDAGG